MDFVYVFALFAIGAYLLQAILGYYQIKHFNTIYQRMRRQGKVAIGRRSGKFRAGTIVMFAVDDDAKVLDAQLMQGVTVVTRFKPKSQYIGQDIHYIDHYHPLVQKENKLTQYAMENAREIYLRVEVGNYEEQRPKTITQHVSLPLMYLKDKIKTTIKGSV